MLRRGSLKTMLENIEVDKIRDILALRINGGIECWFQVELCYFLKTEWINYQIIREKQYPDPLSSNRCDLYVKDFRGNEGYIEIKCMSHLDQDLSVLLNAFYSDIDKIENELSNYPGIEKFCILMYYSQDVEITDEDLPPEIRGNCLFATAGNDIQFIIFSELEIPE